MTARDTSSAPGAAQLEPREAFRAVTSIPPVRTAAGQNNDRHATAISLAVRSFAANGFAVTSVNRPHEIAGLRDVYPTVAFTPDASEGVFKDRYGCTFAGLFAACRNADYAGIINADVYLVRSHIRQALQEHPDRFYVARRSDVTSVGGSLIGTYRRGIDALFFAAERYRPLLDDREIGRLQMGAPFWDIVIPVVASFHGEVVFVSPPIILHPIHPANWSHPDYALVRQVSANAVYSHAKRHAGDSANARKFLSVVDHYFTRRQSLDSKRQVKAVARTIDARLDRIEQRSTERVEIDWNDGFLRDAIGPFVERYDQIYAAEADSLLAGWSPINRLRLALRRRRRRREQERLLAEADRKAVVGSS